MNPKKIFAIVAGVFALGLIFSVTVLGFPPMGDEGAGTLGVSDTTSGRIPGVQQAERFRTGEIGETDVSLDHPEIQALLQNDEVLAIIQSEVFQELQAFEALRQLRDRTSYEWCSFCFSEAFQELQANEALRQNSLSGTIYEGCSWCFSEAFKELQSNETFRQLQSNEAFKDLQANEALREAFELEARSFYREGGARTP